MALRSETLLDHQERMNRVLVFIAERLDTPPMLEEVAAVACYSPFHFHRIFSAFTGETLAVHIRRLRLERAASQLQRDAGNVTDIALGAGYESPAAFTKAFAKQFGCPPTAFRAEHRLAPQKPNQNATQGTHMEPTIKERPDTQVAFVRRTGPYVTAAADAWKTLAKFAFWHGLFRKDTEMIGVCHDNPEITAGDQIRYDACISVKKPVKPKGEVGAATLRGGRFAVFLHHGPYENFNTTYQAIYGDWLPSSGRKLRDEPCLEIYLNNPQRTKPKDLKTEIWVPIVA
jgi:AraC family transcriptional regulator